VEKGHRRAVVVVMENAFHGRTLGTMAASDGPSVRLGFQRLPGDFLKVRFGDMAAIEAITQTFGTRIAAVLLEPIQGESGVVPAPAGYLQALRDHCTRHGWLMMLDEIQTGIGRTGAWFAFQHEGIVPDVMTWPKASAMACPSAPAWLGPPWRNCSHPAAMAAPLAATRSPAEWAARCWTSLKGKACCTTPRNRAHACWHGCGWN
jgi:acetylornithine/succinyldiaminopimelate/putrescine aminotransferase